MKRALCLVVLAGVAAICTSQTQKQFARPNLKKLSSDQLKACYNDKTVCGTDDVNAISDELMRRLPKLSTDQLVACFADWKICGVEDDIETGYAVSAEVARRGSPHELLIPYWTEPDEMVRYSIVQVALHFKSPEVTTFMKRVLAVGKGDDDTLYWPARYLAKGCDPDALKWLSTRQGRPEGCIEFTGTVRAFGKCQYRQAIAYLVSNSLQDACLNIVDDAEYSLEKLYPSHPKRFESLKAEQKYYCDRAKQEGFKVDCSIE